MSACVSCGEEARVYCAECNTSCCNICDGQWHKHPKRRHHRIILLIVRHALLLIRTLKSSLVQRFKHAKAREVGHRFVCV